MVLILSFQTKFTLIFYRGIFFLQLLFVLFFLHLISLIITFVFFFIFFLGQKIVRLWWCARAHKAPRLHQGVSLPRPA